MEDDESGSKRKRRRSGWDSKEPQGIAASAIQPTADPASIALASQQQSMNQPSFNPDMAKLQAALLLAQKTKIQESSRIYVGSLHYDLPEASIRALFSSFGNITGVELSKEPGSNRSKGFCFIEFDNPSSAEAAVLTMNGFELAGRKIKVGRPFGGPGAVPQSSMMPNLGLSGLQFGLTPQNQAQMLLSQALGNAGGAGMQGMGMGMGGLNAALLAGLSGMPLGMSTTTAAVPTPPPPPPPPSPRTILIRNIAPSITTDMLKVVFGSYGAIEHCNMLPSENPSTSTSTSPTTTESTSTSSNGEKPLQSAILKYVDPNSAKEAVKTMKGFPLADMSLGVDLIPDSTSVSTRLSDIGITSSGTGTAQPPAPSTPAPNTIDIGPLCAIVLENMVSVEEAKDPDLKDEIAEECSTHGPLTGVEIVVMGNTSVQITVRYVSASDAVKAFSALNGRFFAGRKVKATLAR
eukprot:gene2994-5870_t